MGAEELCRLPATRLAGMNARREVSSVAVMDPVLGHAERLQPVLNLFALPLFDAARDAARAAEAQVMSGARLGPLHGVPVTMKDNVILRGLPTANGSTTQEAAVAPADAVVAARLAAAGAIVIGRTALPEFTQRRSPTA